MPTYTYRCLHCNELTETTHSMHEKPKVACDYCGGPTHKIILGFPHTKFDWKHYQSADDNLRLVLHRAESGRPTPASQQAGKRV